MAFNLKQKIIDFADGLSKKYLAKKMCPTRPAYYPVNIKPGLSNALIWEKIICRLGCSNLAAYI